MLELSALHKVYILGIHLAKAAPPRVFISLTFQGESKCIALASSSHPVPFKGTMLSTGKVHSPRPQAHKESETQLQIYRKLPYLPNLTTMSLKTYLA